MELAKYWEIVYRRKWLILGSAVLIFVFTFLLLELTPTVYKSRAKVMFRSSNLQQTFISGVPNSLGQMTVVNPDNLIGTVEEMIESSPVINKAIHDIDLRDGDGKYLKMDDFVDPFVLKIFTKGAGVDISNLEASESFEIIGYAKTAAKAKRIPEEVIANLLSEFNNRYRKEMAQAKKAIEKRLGEVAVKFAKVEESVARYKYDSQLYNPAVQISGLVGEINDLESERDKNSRSTESSKAGLRAIEQAAWTNNPKAFKDIQANIESNALLDDYKRQLLSLESSLAKLTAEKTQEHPDVKVTKQQIDLVKDNIKNEVSKSFASQVTGRSPFFDNIAISYANDLSALAGSQAKDKILAKQIMNKKGELREIPAKERRLNELTRESDDLKNVYNALVIDLENVKSAEEISLANVVVVQPPDEPEAYFPPEDNEVFLAAALIGGLCFGLFFAFVFDYIDGTVKTPEDVKRLAGQEVAGVLPWAKELPASMVGGGDAIFDGSLYDVVTNIWTIRAREHKTVSIISHSKGDGRSTVACNLARLVAQTGRKVALVDGDLRSPSVQKAFGVSAAKGLSDYLSSDLRYNDVITRTSLPGLDLVTAGGPQQEPQRLLQSGRCAELMNDLAQAYDYVIVDTPALSEGSDALILSAYAKRALLIVKKGKTPEKSLKGFINGLTQAGVSVAGVLFNGARVKA
ncbi:MAG: polysaccharide biosynthesis tyrosine autokinase [Deltaproteobacteria bacterium]|nr:polysaccharide biosynthesis tyrosine autokinase [Deltaproteobacteria bacterium]